MSNKRKQIIMLEFKKTARDRNDFPKRPRNLIWGVVLGAAVLVLLQAAPASAAVNAFSHTFQATMSPTGVDPNARGSVHGNLTRRGAVDNQRLTVTVSRLDTNTTYHLMAYLGDDIAATAVADLVTDRRGGAFILYIKNPGTHPLPAVVDPLSNIREVDIVNTNGDVVLRADL